MVKEKRLKDREEANKKKAPCCDLDEDMGGGIYRLSEEWALISPL